MEQDKKEIMNSEYGQQTMEQDREIMLRCKLYDLGIINNYGLRTYNYKPFSEIIDDILYEYYKDMDCLSLDIDNEKEYLIYEYNRVNKLLRDVYKLAREDDKNYIDIEEASAAMKEYLDDSIDVIKMIKKRKRR